MARRARLKACAGSARRRRPLEFFGSFAHRNCLKLLEKGSKFSRLRRGLLAPMVRTGGRLRREPAAIGNSHYLLHATIATRVLMCREPLAVSGNAGRLGSRYLVFLPSRSTADLEPSLPAFPESLGWLHLRSPRLGKSAPRRTPCWTPHRLSAAV